MQRILLPVLTLLTLGCNGAKGTYRCSDGLTDEIRLEGGGKAYLKMSMLGEEIESAGTWSQNGDKIELSGDGGSNVFTLKGDTLDGGLLGTCAKQ